MSRNVIATWMSSCANLIAYQSRRFALGAWLILVIAVAIGFYRTQQLAEQNRARIADIQESRYQSCRTTYESFHVIFDPFFPPPAKRTPKQVHDLGKFDDIIAKKIRACREQVTPPPINLERKG